jgi:hypothetical protein
MIVANTNQGTTLTFDLTLPNSQEELNQLLNSGIVTALSIQKNGMQHALVMPKGFKGPLVFGANPIIDKDTMIGELIYVQAYDVRLSLSSTFAGNLIKSSLVHTGIMRYHSHKGGYK